VYFGEMLPPNEASFQKNKRISDRNRHASPQNVVMLLQKKADE
jgi:hypothetical protein